MPTEEQIKEWKERHGEVLCITAGDKDYYLRKPVRAEYKRFIDTLPQSAYDASLTLVAACLLSPSREELMQDINLNPGLHLLLSGELQNAAGGSLAVSSKKL